MCKLFSHIAIKIKIKYPFHWPSRAIQWTIKMPAQTMYLLRKQWIKCQNWVEKKKLIADWWLWWWSKLLRLNVICSLHNARQVPVIIEDESVCVCVCVRLWCFTYSSANNQHLVACSNAMQSLYFYLQPLLGHARSRFSYKMVDAA